MRDWSILTVELSTNQGTATMDLAKDLAINIDNLNEDFCNQPSLYAWWATVACQARAISDKYKLKVEQKEEYIKKTLVGELDLEVRRNLEMDGEKVTEAKVTNGIYSHPRYQEALQELYTIKEEYLDANSKAVTLEVARDAMNQRKDALISLGAQLRNEYNNSELSIKKQQVKSILAKSTGDNSN